MFISMKILLWDASTRFHPSCTSNNLLFKTARWLNLKINSWTEGPEVSQEEAETAYT